LRPVLIYGKNKKNKKYIMKRSLIITDQRVKNIIYNIRGQKVILDRDLAELYNVETRILNQAVKRNKNRFPSDFMFQLTLAELENWKSQIVISNKEKMGIRKLPLAFTEQGVAMLSSVLNSETAIEVNIHIIRIFTRMREVLKSGIDIVLKIERVEKKLLEQDSRGKKHENDIQIIFQALKKLLISPQPERKKIGYKTKVTK
jgi:hypothetical protein